VPFDRSSQLCAFFLLAAVALFGLQQTKLEAHRVHWPVFHELSWQDWLASFACTGNDDVACALGAEP